MNALAAASLAIVMGIPLGAIAIRRSLGARIARETDARLRASVESALHDPRASAGFVRRHAQEMEPEVVRKHIELYVNDYTRSMDRSAVDRLLRFGAEQGFFEPSAAPLFLHER